MSKNIMIQEGGLGKQLTVDKLKTDLVGGGTALWVPEDGVQLTTKYITENGTYTASDDGYYGYSQVTVSGIGKAIGKDGDGDDAVVYPDPQTGQLTEEKLPSYIEVITPPTNPYGIYQNGDTIEKTGMVVKAYLPSGTEYGTVQISEITLDPTTATYDETTDEGITGTATSALIEGSVSYCSQAYSYKNGRRNRAILGRAIAGFPASQEGRLWILKASSESPAYESYDIWPDGSIHNYGTGGTGPYTYDGKTVYYGYENTPNNDSSGIFNIPINEKTGDWEKIAWTMIYGNREETQAGSHQTITVKWPRPYGGKELEDTFEILVAPGYTPNGGE